MENRAKDDGAAPDTARRSLRLPGGLATLCATELWERFSFYGMRSLLILYLVNRRGMDDASAAALYGAYTASIYGFAVLGGWVADRMVGQWHAIAGGAGMILAGHLLLAISDHQSGGAGAVPLSLVGALALIVTGTGLFKPNSTTLVGQLYRDEPEQRTTGYYLFYLGINVGSALAALLCGAVAARWGWGMGFGLAAFGMACGLLLLLTGRAPLAAASAVPPALGWRTVAGPLAMFALASLLLARPMLVGVALAVILATALTLVALFARNQADGRERRQILVALALIAAAAAFWSLSEQAGSTLNLFAERKADLGLGAISLAPAQTQAFNPLFILALTPAVAWFWAARRRSGHEPSDIAKHVAALLLAAAGFALLAGGSVLAGVGKVPLAWLAGAYFLQTLGEVFLAPTAYAAVARIAPRGVAGLLMGLWLFSLSIGNFLGAQVATQIARPTGQGEPPYASVFAATACAGVLAALLLALAAPRLKQWMVPCDR